VLDMDGERRTRARRMSSSPTWTRCERGGGGLLRVDAGGEHHAKACWPSPPSTERCRSLSSARHPHAKHDLVERHALWPDIAPTYHPLREHARCGASSIDYRSTG
jgi:hypothetical protein